MQFNRAVFRIASSIALAALAACGGGGSSNTTANTDISAVAGGWAGTSTSGNTVQAMILENGRLWAITGVVSSGVLMVTGLDQATLQRSDSTLTANNLRAYTFGSTNVITGTMSGTFTAGTTITAVATSSTGLSSTITLAPAPTSSYDYNTPATATAISGTWTGSFSNSTGTIAVAANGTFSGRDGLGCNMSGSIVPRASGKNVYDVTVNFGASPCGLPNGSASGNAVITNLTTGAKQLTVAVATADGSNAGVFFGQR